jgi:hypothetical protein
MNKLRDLEASMRAQFVWNKEPVRHMQTDEFYEGSTESARIVFIGLSDFYKFEPLEVCDHLDITYETYLSRVKEFKAMYKAAQKGEALTSQEKRLYAKTRLCLNAIWTSTRRNPYLKFDEE